MLNLRETRKWLALCPNIGPMARMKWLARAATEIDDSVNRRAGVAQRLAACESDGQVHVEVWSRDCDHCESTSLVRIPATLQAFYGLWKREAEDAEGPFSLTIIRPEDVERFKPSFRDRGLEAFENGHPHFIDTSN